MGKRGDKVGIDAAPWATSFQIDGAPSGHIVAKQRDGNEFGLASRILFLGEETGLEGKLSPDTIDATRPDSPRRARARGGAE